jgi:hypothetical protein
MTCRTPGRRHAATASADDEVVKVGVSLRHLQPHHILTESSLAEVEGIAVVKQAAEHRQKCENSYNHYVFCVNCEDL